MPVRDGRWISPAKYIEAEKAETTALVEPVDDEAAALEAPKPKRSRRSKKAAESAVAKATGLDLTLED